ncbi:hypothetical protein A6B43_00695 [Vespertiliibacter pulmonis]|uniref:Uncharacterized protein n=1 Tax=Vespertiliibacter pulmonis TaxID=1443036 RepID=A0A3N4WJL6_9PAST|nr:hypothetical protein [Vespertiliibacter pulmonis]QLB20158.1 hypothetical protein A6B43_00695 [Vespertiliibacter pulmonis]RPE86130.1 hypothetical protein EDC46_0523 [Vespertiliibacter pulmonis]
MKLTKIFAALVVAGALAACNETSNPVTSAVNGVKDVASSAANGVKEAATSATNAVTTAVENTANSAKQMVSSQPTFETAAYYCDVEGKKNQVVSVTYAFVDGKVDSATVSIHKKVVGQEMKFDSAYKDGTRFVEGNKVWSLDYGFSAATVGKTVPVMFTDNNKILAKSCQVIAR